MPKLIRVIKDIVKQIVSSTSLMLCNNQYCNENQQTSSWVKLSLPHECK